jgi:antitoxin component YwqK of YwqJK toxin-antitoxin module
MINDFATRGTITASEFENIKAEYKTVPQFNPTSGSYSGPDSPGKLDTFKTASEIEVSKISFNALTPAEKIGFKHIFIEHAPTGLKILGTAAIAYDVVTSTAQAAKLLEQGNNEAAALTLSQLAGRLYLGLEGAAAGLALGSAAGPVTGIFVALAGGIAGAVVGDKAVEMLWAAGREALYRMGITETNGRDLLVVVRGENSDFKQIKDDLKNAGVPNDIRQILLEKLIDKNQHDFEINPNVKMADTIAELKSEIQAIKDAYGAAPKIITGTTISGLGEDGADIAYVDSNGRRTATFDKNISPLSDDKVIVTTQDGEKTTITTSELNGTTIKREDIGNHQTWQTVEEKYQHNPTGADELLTRTTKLDSGQSSVTTYDPLNLSPEAFHRTNYDSLGRVVSYTSAGDDGTAIRTDYDVAGRPDLALAYDAAGILRVRTAYDDMSRVDEVKVFDAAGRLDSLSTYTDASQLSTVYSYDDAGRVDTYLHYSAAGKLDTGYTYDDANRVDTVTFYDLSGRPDVIYIYDDAERIDSINLFDDNPRLAKVYAYDDFGHLASEGFYDDGGRADKIILYDTAGRIDSVYVYDDASQLDRATAYDDAGRVNTDSFYDDAGRVQSDQSL